MGCESKLGEVFMKVGVSGPQELSTQGATINLTPGFGT